MILIFDMDDTLYDESTYVKSSFKAVANYLSKKYLLPYNNLLRSSLQILDENGRGKIFDELLIKNNIYTKTEVRNCLSVYRGNTPDISIFKEAEQVLTYLKDYSKYLVTDGNKNVQYKKVKALGLKRYFKKIFLTHRYGIKNAKPSTYCFTLIKELEGCEWNDMTYIADDPNKDFVNLKPLGMKTVRVLKGRFKNQRAKKKYDAKFNINNLTELTKLLGI